MPRAGLACRGLGSPRLVGNLTVTRCRAPGQGLVCWLWGIPASYGPRSSESFLLERCVPLVGNEMLPSSFQAWDSVRCLVSYIYIVICRREEINIPEVKKFDIDVSADQQPCPSLVLAAGNHEVGDDKISAIPKATLKAGPPGLGRTRGKSESSGELGRVPPGC